MRAFSPALLRILGALISLAAKWWSKGAHTIPVESCWKKMRIRSRSMWHSGSVPHRVANFGAALVSLL